MADSSSTNEVDFGFAFNDVDFSDRVLRLEIIPTLTSNMNSSGEKYLNWFSPLDANDSECGNDFELKTLHISSILLAAKSQFFYKLFKNGMKESQNKNAQVALRINASEEEALMDVLNCVYDKPLKATSAHDLLDVLMAADKFEVTTCMRLCIQLLLKLPISTENALLYLELPVSVLEGKVVQPLTTSTKPYLAAHFRDFTESHEELMPLPLSALEIVLGSDGLKVDSEDDVFDFILNCVRVNYTKLEERREILTKHLTPNICFQYMSNLKLKEALECPDIDNEQVSKLVINALSKDQVLPTTKCGFPRRVYKHRLVKVVPFECTQPRCVVYFDLKKEECADLFPSKQLCSQPFNVGGHLLNLRASCFQLYSHCFGLDAKMTEDSETCIIDYEFSVMTKSSKKFLSNGESSNYNLTSKGMREWEWFTIPWTTFMSDDSDYFIDGILHLRAQITINN